MSLKSILLLALIFFPSLAFGFTSTGVEEVIDSNLGEKPAPIIEITDINDDVTLGLTSTSVYMVISEQTREQINKDLEEAYHKEMESFNDSFGSFIVGEYQPLTDRKIEYDLDDIENIKDINGILTFTYFKEYSVRFEDVLAINGKQVLASFQKEDIQNFINEFEKV